jgi:hypothetical protein
VELGDAVGLPIFHCNVRRRTAPGKVGWKRHNEDDDVEKCEFDLRELAHAPPNGPELTGADPHAEQYSAREAATRGAASGAAWSWARAIGDTSYSPSGWVSKLRYRCS